MWKPTTKIKESEMKARFVEKVWAELIRWKGKSLRCIEAVWNVWAVFVVMKQNFWKWAKTRKDKNNENVLKDGESVDEWSFWIKRLVCRNFNNNPSLIKKAIT